MGDKEFARQIRVLPDTTAEAEETYFFGSADAGSGDAQVVFSPSVFPEDRDKIGIGDQDGSSVNQNVTEAQISDIAKNLEIQVEVDAFRLRQGMSDPDRDHRWRRIFGDIPEGLQEQFNSIHSALDAGFVLGSRGDLHASDITSDVGVFSLNQDADAAYLLTCLSISKIRTKDEYWDRDLMTSFGGEVVAELWPGRSLGDRELLDASVHDVIKAALQSRPATPTPQPL